MPDNCRIRINLVSGEVEIEGSPEFVTNQLQSLESTVRLIRDILVKAPAPKESSSPNSPSPDGGKPQTAQTTHRGLDTDTFGELLHAIPKGSTDVEKALAAGFFVQKGSEENDFKTAEVTKILKDHSIKLSNTSQSLKQCKENDYIFQTRKVGNTIYYRISIDGKEHLQNLIVAED